MRTQVTIGISKIPSTGEYKIFWQEGRKYLDTKSYYTDCPTDAVKTLKSIYLSAKKSGKSIQVSKGRSTQTLLYRYLLEKEK